MQRRASIGALLLVASGAILGATVFRTDIAQATGLAQPPTPVREQNLDGGGNIRVHEQGVVPVEGTVSALPAAPTSPWSDSEGMSIGGNSNAVLAGPSLTIDLTSFSTSVSPGDLAYISLIAEYVPDTATNCTGASGGSIVYALNNVSGPVTAAFPHPPADQRPERTQGVLVGGSRRHGRQ
jgi:hypothetical protein